MPLKSKTMTNEQRVYANKDLRSLMQYVPVLGKHLIAVGWKNDSTGEILIHDRYYISEVSEGGTLYTIPQNIDIPEASINVEPRTIDGKSDEEIAIEQQRKELLYTLRDTTLSEEYRLKRLSSYIDAFVDSQSTHPLSVEENAKEYDMRERISEIMHTNDCPLSNNDDTFPWAYGKAIEAYKLGIFHAKEQGDKECIEFADWLHYNQFVRFVGDVLYGAHKGSNENIWISTKIHYGAGATYWSTDQLFDIYKQSKQK